MFRSILFAILFYLSTAVLCFVWLPLVVLPRRVFSYFSELWVRLMLAIVSGILGIRCNVQGRENIPDGPCIFASKHQSTWDVLIYKVLIPDCAYVLKRDLFYIPLWGWYLWRTGMVGVDRSGGAKALRRMVSQAKKILADGRSIIIFPQGTRTAPGEKKPYQPGVAALYMNAGVPVVPVALNSGTFWPRRKFKKNPGYVSLQFLPAIQPGLNRKAFINVLEDRIEAATNTLESNNIDDDPAHPVNDCATGAVENHVEKASNLDAADKLKKKQLVND